jgi:hypothetical protein
MFRGVVPAIAAELPFNVSVQVVTPDAESWGVLNDGVMPAGRPEAKLMLAAPGLAGPFAPKAGDAWIKMVAEPADCMVAEEGAATTIPGVCKLIFWVAVSPSPVALMVTGTVPIGIDEEAERVRVHEPVEAGSETGLLQKVAVTPAGSPAALRLTGPLKDPPVVKLRTVVAVPPGGRVSCEA